MGLRADTLERWGQAAPVEAEEPWPPFVRAEPGTRIELVVRWNETVKVDRSLRWVIRFVFWWKGVNLTPHRLEFVGPASSEEKAKAVCLDGNHCSFPMTVDRFYPPEPVNVRGVKFWKRRLHKLFWLTEPEEVDHLVVMRESEVRAARSSLAGAKERLRSIR